MKKIFTIIGLFLAVIAADAQNNHCSQGSQCCKSNQTSECSKANQTSDCCQAIYTRPCTDTAEIAKATAWMNSGAWRNGFTKADPHASVNAVEFYRQYQLNPEQWKALFSWIAKTDLLSLPSGRTPIPGTKLVASVEDDKNGPLETRQSESHYHHIDFQYVLRGCERFGIIDHLSSKPNTTYQPDVMHYDYDKSKARFYDSDPAHFFIFFPGDWHIAKVKTDQPDQNIRVVVIKVDYIDEGK